MLLLDILLEVNHVIVGHPTGVNHVIVGHPTGVNHAIVGHPTEGKSCIYNQNLNLVT